MQLRNLAANSPRRSRLLSSNKTPKTIPEESHSEKKSTDRKTAAAPSSTTAEPPPGEDASPNAFFVNNFWESDGPKILCVWCWCWCVCVGTQTHLEGHS